MDNPLDGILPDFSIFGAEFTELWQKLLAGLWGIAILLAVVFVIMGVTRMASASAGGNPNEYLDGKMRDFDVEAAYLRAKEENKEYNGTLVRVYNSKPIVPLTLKLTPAEKKDLVLFLRSLQGDAPHPLVGDKTVYPK